MKHLFILLTFVCASNIAIANETFSLDFQVGTNYSGLSRITTSDYNYHKQLEDHNLQLNLQYRITSHFLAYGKFLHHESETNAGHQWSQTTKQWHEIEQDFKMSSSFFAVGGKIDTRLWKGVSTAVYLGYGYLDNPDNIYNSNKGQFDVGAELTYSFHSNWDLIISWTHISNGRQIFGRGGKNSEFYPNNGRDYLNAGVRYHFY